MSTGVVTMGGAIAARLPGLRGYVQCPALDVPGYQRSLDGCPIVWFDDLAANRAAVRSAVWAEVKADEPNFLLPERLIGLATTEAR